MSEPDQILDVLQADIVALLKNTPALADAFVFTGTEKDLATRLNRTFGPRTNSAGGKRGLGIQVLPVFVDDSESNLPGPPLNLRIQILTIESVTLNRNADHGTLKTSSQAALNILAALHLMQIGSHAIYSQKNPITPEKMDDGFEGHLVTVYVRANGVQGPGKPAQVTAEVTAGVGTADLIIAGVTYPTVMNRTLPEVAPMNGNRRWFYQDAEITYDVYRSPGVPDTWNINYQSDAVTGSFYSEDDVETPDLAENWNPGDEAIGFPTITLGPTNSSNLTLTCATAGASIYYTTDGSYPEPENGTLYSAPFAMPDTGTLVRAAAYKTGLNPGDCLEFTITE